MRLLLGPGILHSEQPGAWRLEPHGTTLLSFTHAKEIPLKRAVRFSPRAATRRASALSKQISRRGACLVSARARPSTHNPQFRPRNVTKQSKSVRLETVTDTCWNIRARWIGEGEEMLLGVRRGNVEDVFASELKARMHRLVVRVALRLLVPLRGGIEEPQQRHQNLSCRHRFAYRATVGSALPDQLLPNPLPLTVTQPLHAFDCWQRNSLCNRF